MEEEQRCESEFCAMCGSILPLAESKDIVRCLLCKNAVPIDIFNGTTNTSYVVFNDRQAVLKSIKKMDTTEAEGRIVERTCAKCNNDKMTYATLQTRSADEGQTIFYSCPKCGYQENENS